MTSEGGATLLARIDEYGRAAWLGFVLPAFWAAWPFGLAMVAILVTGGRTQALPDKAQRASVRWFDQRRTVRDLAKRTGGTAALWSSHDQTFNTCRTVGLDQLNIQENDFRAFLNRLCLARTNEEFDRLVTERGYGGAGLSSEWSDA